MSYTIVSKRYLNIHSASTPGGLISLSPGVSKVVPEDVEDHPAFDLLLNAEIITIKYPAEVPEVDVKLSLGLKPEEVKPEEVEPEEVKAKKVIGK